MADVQFEVVPFGARWAVLKGPRQLSTHAEFEAALQEAGRAAYRVRSSGDECRILVRERSGEWREMPCPDVADFSLSLRMGR